MTQSQENKSLKWFAARVIRERAYVDKMLKIEKVETSGIADIPSLLFIRCTQGKIEELRRMLWDRMLFYRSADKSFVEPIPDEQMEVLRLLERLHDDPVILLSVEDLRLFEGPVMRVKSGIFAGCEGVIKRIKGDRRLIIKISDKAAVATPYIPREMMEEMT